MPPNLDVYTGVAEVLDESLGLGRMKRAKTDGPRPRHILFSIVYKQAGGAICPHELTLAKPVFRLLDVEDTMRRGGQSAVSVPPIGEARAADIDEERVGSGHESVTLGAPRRRVAA